MRLRVIVSYCCLLSSVACGGAEPQIYFSPNGQCTAAVVAEIAGARSEVLVQAYSFTSEPITAALLAAKKRGVGVSVILDAGQEHQVAVPDSPLRRLRHAGIEVLIDHQHAIAHNKIIIIDGKTVCTGSFNFTDQAEHRNAENLIILYDAEVAARYRENWQKHHDHSLPPHKQ